MELTGTVLNGIVVPDMGMHLPQDGTRVRIILHEASHEEVVRPTLGELLSPFIVEECDLPEDYSRNHEHYMYGTEKR